MDEFVQVRRKDDPDVILPQPLAKSALQYFPDWEPIPTDTSEPAAEAEPPVEQVPEPEPTSRTRRSGRKASTDTTETEGDTGNG